MKVSKQFALGLRKIAEQGTSLISDQEALEFRTIVPEWIIGKEYKAGDRVSIEENGDLVLYKCLQSHKSQENWKPATATASLWTHIDEVHAGTKEDPIPAVMNMEYTKGLYYSENGELFLCTRDSGQPLVYFPSQLIGHYFEKA